MRCLFISKRQYTNKDLIDDRFGRCRELPLQLSVLNHQVVGTCLSYKKKPELIVQDSTDSASVEWHSINAGRIKLLGAIRYTYYTYKLARRFRPDIIIATSDSIYGVIALILARLLRKPYVFDLYDNYESFAAYKLPFMRILYGSAIRNANLITVVSEPLKQHILNIYKRKGPTVVLENGVDPKLFHPLPKNECRIAMGLPTEPKLIGVAGAISGSRGIGIVFAAFSELLADWPDIRLVLAGKVDNDVEVNASDNIIVLGELPYEKMPQLIASLDVSIVSNIDSPFGRYCYPQKFTEAIATGTPTVVAAIGAMKTLLKDTPEILFRPGDADDLVRAIRHQLVHGKIPGNPWNTWLDLARRLDHSINSMDQK